MKNNRKRGINPKFIFGLLAVLCVAGIGASFVFDGSGQIGGRITGTILAPMQQGINSIGGIAAKATDKQRNITVLESENADLRNQIESLQAQLSSMENNLADYEDLLQLMKLSEKYPTYETTGARIISKDAGNWYDTFTINKGSLDGIMQDMNVIADNGLVGIVTQVNANSAVVRSIIDDSSSVSGMISKNMDICIVSGDLTLIDEGLLAVELISSESTTVDGDEVVTSYISDKFLPGLRIGYISDMTLDDSELSYNAKLTPIVDFQHLSNVLVIKQLKKDMTATDESQVGE